MSAENNRSIRDDAAVFLEKCAFFSLDPKSTKRLLLQLAPSSCELQDDGDFIPKDAFGEFYRALLEHYSIPELIIADMDGAWHTLSQ
jgi:hypothetical protein